MVRKKQILIVDDEPAIVRLVRVKLESDGYAVLTASRGEEALRMLQVDHPDLVILDLMMPDMDGTETLRRIRSRSQLPVIMLTALGSDREKVKGLEGGADDFVTKPFNPDELVARVAAVLRRVNGDGARSDLTVLRYPGVEIDLERRHVTVSGNEVRFSRTEWALLDQLGSNVGRVMLHGELLTRIWGPEFRDEASYLRTWVSRIRSKLKSDSDDATILTTFPGVGYRLEPPAE
jgi:two-component system KDP operon response regulator KdpE